MKVSKDYAHIIDQIKAITENESNLIANLANIAAVLFNSLKEVNWAGFYLVEDDALVLGPFQGQVACIRIANGKGVCGKALSTGNTQRVEDVHLFEGHIACDAASQSEIVIPLKRRGEVVAVLDIDSPKIARFTEQDQKALEVLSHYIETLFK